MAILYGTTADGQSLPVQVNEFGQLVAQGLPGPQGEQGEQGEPGPPGNGGVLPEVEDGLFVPTLESSSEGTALIEYAQQAGYWYRWGPFLGIDVLIQTLSIVVTNARGKLQIGGLPESVRWAAPSSASLKSMCNVGQFWLPSQNPHQLASFQPINGSDRIKVFLPYVEGNGTVDYSSIFHSNDSQLTICFSLRGFATGSVRDFQPLLDRLL